MRTSVAGESSEKVFVTGGRDNPVTTLPVPPPRTGVSQSHGSAKSVTTALTDYSRLHCRNVYP